MFWEHIVRWGVLFVILLSGSRASSAMSRIVGGARSQSKPVRPEACQHRKVCTVENRLYGVVGLICANPDCLEALPLDFRPKNGSIYGEVPYYWSAEEKERIATPEEAECASIRRSLLAAMLEQHRIWQQDDK